MDFRSIKLYKGEEVDLDNLVHSLAGFGYRRQASVGDQGEFALRGGVLDIFPVTFDFPLRIDLDGAGISSIASFDIASGRRLFEHTIVIILPKRRPQASRFRSDQPLENFIDLRPGDYVVHTQYGIGRYRGITRQECPGKTSSSGSGRDKQEHMVIEYAQGDRLYVPKEFMHLVQKYIPCCGAGKRLRRRPHIYKLGSKEWQRVRNRAKRGIERMSFELLRIQAARNNVSGFKFSRDADWQARFEQGFPWAETPGQAKCIQDVKRDMQQARPMDRLICGDVGYGKTEVAMRAAFKAVLDNKQVAFLVPTTILAEQHFQNLKERIKDFPIKIAMLSRFRSKKEQGEVVEGLIRGRVDIVIGTHRLLSRDLVFKDLGLLIIDEEQRFGVRAKERLKSLRLTVDVLTLTATPIPRTLYMGLMQVRDMSVIETPPAQRLAVETQVHCFDTGLIRQAIANELRRKGQVYFVHNRILDIDDVAARLRRLSPPRARVMTAHGAMPARGLEKVMAEFLRGDIDVLVCTMIIQSGIDVPNANTLIVNNAERFGLSDLHQLRGRIGRFKRRAYAFFLISGKGVPDERARARLSAITNYSALGSGFKIAFEDMVLRGTGNLLGPQQHGYINAIGFDLYCRLLREVVSFGKNKI